MDRRTVYLDAPAHPTYGHAYDERGSRIGTWIQTHLWHKQGRNGHWTSMHSVQVALHDLSEWYGTARYAHPYAVRVTRKKGT